MVLQALGAVVAVAVAAVTFGEFDTRFAKAITVAYFALTVIVLVGRLVWPFLPGVAA